MPDRPDHHVDLHVPKLETFDVPASANVDPKGFVREVDSFTVHPHGLYMRRGADHPEFGYLESWLLPALGLRVNVFHFRPGATPNSHRYIDVVEVGGDRRGDGARDVGKRGGTPEGMGGGAPTAATRTAPMTEPGDLPVDVWRTRDLYLDILELDGRVRVEDADELTAALAADPVSYTNESTAERIVQLENYLSLITALALALLGIGVLIALVGISNTLRVTILERRQEIGLQRALGLLRSQIRAALTSETLVLSILGGLIGLITGASIAVAGVYSLATSVEGLRFSLNLPLSFFTILFLTTLIVAVAAALLTSRKATQVSPVAAIVS